MEDSGIIKAVSKGYTELFSSSAVRILPMPRSGSERRYFRIADSKKTIIGVYNENVEENEAFTGFTRHFREKSLPVPELLGYLPEKSVYFLQDLGDDNLYKWLHKKPALAPFDQDTLLFYKRILDNLILFQTRGIDGLDLDLCYPHKSFDRQSMIWDMNYFKYMFLKLVGAPFNELRLEQDFMTLAEFLLAAGHNYFLYRDFQTANIMVVGEDPWFIDYQGGRKGPPQYDIASILYDAKIPMKDSDRELLLEYYIENFCLNTNENKTFMRKYYEGFVIIRIMQALGAFGFRGLYERKPTFTESIVPGVRLLNQIIDQAESHISLPGLYATIKSIPRTEIFINLSKNYHLYISGQ